LLDVVAPAGVPTTDLGGGYTMTYYGTSSAAPHVAGVAALMLSVNPNLTQQQVGQIIEQTARQIRPDIYNYDFNNPNRPNGGWHEQMGYGLIDACAAVAMAAGTTCSKKITKHYVENICRSDSNYSNVILKPDDIANFNDAGAKWYFGELDDANIITGNNGKGTFDLAEYLSNIPTVSNPNVYLELSDGTTYQWTVNVIDVEETLAEYYRNNPQYGITVSPDGKSGTIFFNNTSTMHISLQCPFASVNAYHFNLATTSFEVGDSNSFYISANGFPQLGSSGGNLAMSFIFKNVSEICSETIKVITFCKTCKEEFTFRLFNQDLFILPTLEIVQICNGDLMLISQGGNNCGLDLESRWIRIYAEEVECEECEGEGCNNCEEGIVVVEKAEEAEDGRNSNGVVVSKKGKYRIEYFHIADPSTILYSADTNITDDILDELTVDLPFTLRISEINKRFIVEEEEEEDTFRCRFDITLRAEGSTYAELRGYTFRVLYNDASEYFYKETPSSGREYFVSIEMDCLPGDGIFGLTVETYKEGVGFLCQQIFPHILYCGCENKCDSLGLKLVGMENEKDKGGEGLPSCGFTYRVPDGYRIVSVSPELPDGSVLESDHFHFSMRSPCGGDTVEVLPGGLVIIHPPLAGGGTYLRAYEITIVREDDEDAVPCVLTEVFSCGCWARLYHLDISQSIGGLVEVSYELSDFLTDFIPIDLYLNDNIGNRLKHLYQITIPSQLNGQFDFNMLKYPSGVYHITIENNEQIFGGNKFIFAK